MPVDVGREPNASPAKEGGDRQEVRLADDAEARDALDWLLPHVEALDVGATRPPAGRLDQSFDVVRGAFEHRLDAPVATVPNPARDAVVQRSLSESVPEEHALNEPVSYNAPPLHSHILAALRDSRCQHSGQNT